MTIAVYDLPEYEEHIKYIRKSYVESGGLLYGWKSNGNLPFDQGHWNRQVMRRSRHYKYDASELPHFSDPAIVELWNALNEQLGGRALVRCYINGYSYGTDGYVHTEDHPTADIEDGQSETIFVYLNDKWNINWGGETILLDGEQEIVKAVIPKKNRAFVFDSHLLHAARPLTRACSELRSIIVFKTANKELFDNPAVKWLIDNTNQEHTGRTLFQHLWFTCRILEENGFPKEVCGAGLFHSVYGTTEWKSITTEDREKVRGFIERRGEELVWEFHKLSRDRFKDVMEGDYSQYDPEFKQDLMAICWANALEQNPVGPNAHMHQCWEPYLQGVDFSRQRYLIL